MRHNGIGVLILLILATDQGRTWATGPPSGVIPTAQESRAGGERPVGAGVEAREKAVRAKLETRVTLRHPKGAPLKQVIAEIAKATRGPHDAGLPIYVDPIGLLSVEKSLDSPVTVDVTSARVKDVLPRSLSPLGLAYRVHDAVVVISEPDFLNESFSTIPAIAHDTTSASSAVFAKLERPVAMHYPKFTPLRKVLEDIRKATSGPNDPGLPIQVSPKGLELAEKTMDSVVTIDLEGVPLRTTLRFVLRQLGMDFYVKGGIVRISDLDSIEKGKG